MIRHFQVVPHGESATSYDLWALDMAGALWRATVHPGKPLAWYRVEGPPSMPTVDMTPAG